MTTPGGVPNLPVGALTPDSLGQKLQDQTASAMHGRAGERMPSIFNSSSGGNILNDLSPFGIITRIWAEVNSAIANADPADINGPEDIPPLLLDFIESLPVVGELVGLLEAIIGEYDGDDDVLLAIQQIFMPLRRLVQLVAGKDVGFPTIAEVTAGWEDLWDALENLPVIGPIVEALTGIADGDLPDLEAWARKLLGPDSPLNAGNLFGRLGGHLFGQIALPVVADISPELLPNGGFDDPISIANHPDFVHDATVGRTRPGSAKLREPADGTVREPLVMVTPVPVVQNENVPVSVWVRWEGLTAAGGDPISLSVAGYSVDQESNVRTLTGVTLVEAITAPAADSSAHAGQVDGWVKLSGAYIVPAAVDEIVLQLDVTEHATAGMVWFDDASLKKAGQPGWLQDVWGRIQSVIDRIWHAITGIPGQVGKTLTDLFDALTEIPQANISGLTSALDSAGQGIRDAIVQALGGSGTGHTNADVLNALLNIPTSVVTGLDAALSDAGQSLRDAIVQALGGTGTGHSNSDVLQALMNIPRDAVQGLAEINTTVQQITSILAGAVVNNPINSIVQSVIAWYNSWFGGGSQNYIPLNQKGAANGVCPLDVNGVVPLNRLPASVGGTGGDEAGHTYALLTPLGVTNVPGDGSAVRVAWSQEGSEGVAFDTPKEWFRVTKAGWWHFEAMVRWPASGVGRRRIALLRSSSAGARELAAQETEAGTLGDTVTRVATMQLVMDGTLNTHQIGLNDMFAVEVRSDSAESVAAQGFPQGTMVMATYYGPAIIPSGPVTTVFDTPGTYTWTPPAWFRLGLDVVDVIAIGGGGSGAMSPPTQNGNGVAGQNSGVSQGGTAIVTANGGAAGTGVNNSSDPEYARGGTAGPYVYNGVTYESGEGGPGGPLINGGGPGQNGSAPGAGGGGRSNNNYVSYGGGKSGAWAADTVAPSGSLSVTVGDGGPKVGSGSVISGDGAPGRVWIVARQA